MLSRDTACQQQQQQQERQPSISSDARPSTASSAATVSTESALPPEAEATATIAAHPFSSFIDALVGAFAVSLN
ncbi:unnamed protein product [Gongylonema pulchrum]|uniref:Secreted protein n=1 Tax=Gongylonema pulchrum TaxID=637853 RepID=A0A183ECC8_9BILA|nr:unnamed protein product [Gongylonema pulchrum]